MAEKNEPIAKTIDQGLRVISHSCLFHICIIHNLTFFEKKVCLAMQIICTNLAMARYLLFIVSLIHFFFACVDFWVIVVVDVVVSIRRWLYSWKQVRYTFLISFGVLYDCDLDDRYRHLIDQPHSALRWVNDVVKVYSNSKKNIVRTNLIDCICKTKTIIRDQIGTMRVRCNYRPNSPRSHSPTNVDLTPCS